MLDLQQGRISSVEILVDISQIPEMMLIEDRQGTLFIGAAVPLTNVIASPLLEAHAKALIEAANLIGGPQVRNVATLGGNVGHALPAADGTIALLALDAKAEVAGPAGTRLVPLEDLFLGPGKSALDPQKDILVGFLINHKKPNQASAFRRVMRPQGVAIAILNLAVWIERDGERIQDIRISSGPAGPKPFRARSTEKEICGQRMEREVIQAGLNTFLGEARFRTSPQRATEEYRRHLAGILLEETILAAWSRTENSAGKRS